LLSPLLKFISDLLINRTRFYLAFGFHPLARRNAFAFAFQLTLGKVDGLLTGAAGVRPVKFI
jgi:hypothetical protein